MLEYETVEGMKLFVKNTPVKNAPNTKVGAAPMTTEVNMFFERKADDSIVFTIQEIKGGGRTYHHSAQLSINRLAEVLDRLGLKISPY